MSSENLVSLWLTTLREDCYVLPGWIDPSSQPFVLEMMLFNHADESLYIHKAEPLGQTYTRRTGVDFLGPGPQITLVRTYEGSKQNSRNWRIDMCWARDLDKRLTFLEEVEKVTDFEEVKPNERTLITVILNGEGCTLAHWLDRGLINLEEEYELTVVQDERINEAWPSPHVLDEFEPVEVLDETAWLNPVRFTQW